MERCCLSDNQVFSDGSAARTLWYAAPLTPSSTWAGRRQKGAGQRSQGARGQTPAGWGGGRSVCGL